MEHINPCVTERTFAIKRWSAWLPEQSIDDSKQAWSNARNLALESTTPDLSFLPLMQRRRLTPLARAAVAVAWNCWQPGDQIPTIFCSTHGETTRCFNILSVLADNQDVSPTQFTLSVHSGVAAVFSILTENQTAYIAMAPSEDNHTNALLEAYGLICEQNSEILVVFYDQPIPDIYRSTTASPSIISVLALRLKKPDQQPGECLLNIAPSQNNKKQNDAKSLEKIISAICNGETTIETEQWRWEKTIVD
ncbi:MAG: beta-ketoacyl synthase chain length factor [Methylococcales bacterium]